MDPSIVGEFNRGEIVSSDLPISYQNYSASLWSASTNTGLSRVSV